MSDPNLSGKWRILSLLAAAELLAMTLWFSASAVVPQLTAHWQLSSGQKAWLTISVQIGFVIGALLSAITNISDRVNLRKLIAASAICGAIFNAAIPGLSVGLEWALVLRALTGACLAGVYPPGMKLMATWCKADRGLGIGLLVGAITLGSATPHLLNALPIFGTVGVPEWRSVLWTASGLALLGGLIPLFFTRPGPYLSAAAPFNWRFAIAALKHKPTRLANYGYLGHMWELYAMWTWAPFLLIAAYSQAGWSDTAARLAGFGAVATGAIGSILAGVLADRWGRTTIAIGSLVISGACCAVAGLFFTHPGWLTVLCLIWGFAVVADSAQFSTAISELTDPRYVGTMLTIQTSLGFLLTVPAIQIIPVLMESVSIEWVFPILALGPLFGIWSMARLRGLPEATQMASGNR